MYPCCRLFHAHTFRHFIGFLTFSCVAGQSIKRSLATRLAFDETMEEPQSTRKISKLDSDFSFQAGAGSGLRRFTSENIDSVSKLQRDHQELRARTKQMEAELAGERAKVASTESRARNLELERERDRVEWERARAALEREKQDSKDAADTLRCKLKQVKQRESDRLEEGFRSRKTSIDRVAELELRVANLRQENSNLSEELTESRMALSSKPDVDKMKYNQEIQEYRNKISDLESNSLYLNAEVQRLQNKKVEGEESIAKLESVTHELKMEKLRGDQLQGELEANKEAVIQRSVMREKLEKYDELEKENIRLRSTNKLLTDTAENAALLKEKVKQIESDRKRLEARCLHMHEVTAELEVVKQLNREWSAMVRDWVPAEDRAGRGGDEAEVSVATARGLVRAWQQRELAYVDQVASLSHQQAQLQTSLGQRSDLSTQLETDLAKVRREQEDQARLLKKLQRKLLLVTKERDSFKGVLESYEKEMTVSEDNVYLDKINALEKNNSEYKAMVDLLMEESKEGSTTKSVENNTEIIELRKNLQSLQEKNEKLEMELERRAIKGDFNPTDTKVLHFKNNPTAVAVDKRAAEMSELLNENSALKARIQLLEEGQTKDLTLMVGAKVEEGEAEKIKEMKVQLEKAEKREKRFMEAFSKTSQDFREIVYKLTGFRIDGLADNMYRLKPMYADTQEDNLMFQKKEDGEVCMLESDFSLELGALMEEHLEKHNSIPMFLAGLIRKLYFKRHGISEEDMEDYDDGDNDDEEDDNRDDDSDDESDSGEPSEDEIIEIDDD